MTLKEIESFILLALQRSISQQVIGLANLTSVEQLATRQAVRTWLNGESAKLLTLLRLFPATGTYAIAHAFAEGTPKANGDSKSTWEALEAHLGVMPQGYGRLHLHTEYGKACQKLGLHFVKKEKASSPDDEEEDFDALIFRLASRTHQKPSNESGYLINPMKFQAGILPNWTQHLTEAIRLELSHGALDPDPDDIGAVRHFCNNLLMRVPDGQVTLYKMMESEVGTIVIAALLQAKEQDRYDLIPPHLREPLRKAFEDESIRGAKTRRPRITLNPHRQQLTLHLPATTRTGSPSWEIRGAKPTAYDACFERTVTLARHHYTPTGEVKLALLREGKEVVTQSFRPLPTREVPCVLFEAENGKLLPAAATGPSCELKPGRYHLLVENQARDYAQPWSDLHEHVEISLSPRETEDAVEIESYGKSLTFTCQRNAWIGISSESELLTCDTRKIHHTGFPLVARAYVPESLENERPVLRIERSGDVRSTESIEIEMLADPEYPGHYKAVLPDLAPLKPGPPIRLLAMMRCGSTSCSAEFLHWQGFKRISESGLECDRLPQATLLHGLEPTSNTHLGFTDDDEGRLRISGPGIATIELRRPGLTVRIHDSKRGIRAIPHMAQLAVAREDQARLLIRLEGKATGEVRVSGMQPVLIDADHPYNRALFDCFIASQRRSRVELEVCVNGEVRHRAVFAESMTGRNMTPVSGGFCFDVDATRTRALNLDLIPYANGIDPDTVTLVVEPAGTSGEKIFDTPHPLVVKWRTVDADNRRWTVAIPEALRGVATLARIGVKRENDDGMAELKFAENAGDSEGLLWLRREIESEGKSAFGRLLTNPRSGLSGIPAAQLTAMTGKLAELTLCKYPSAVWADIAKWLPCAQRTAIALAMNHTAKTPDTISHLLGQALAQYAKKSRPTTSVFASLMLGAAPRLLAQPGGNYAGITLEENHRLTEANLTQLVQLGEAGSVRDYLLGIINPQHLSPGLTIHPACLANDIPFSKANAFFPPAFQGRFHDCGKPGVLKMDDYLKKIRGTTSKDSVLRTLAETGDVQTKPNLLSAAHVYACLRQMEHRIVTCGIPENDHFAPFRIALGHATQFTSTATSPLRKKLNGSYIELRLSHTDMALREETPHWKSWTVNPFVSELEHATFLIAGLARMNAQNKTPQEFENQLQAWLGDLGKSKTSPGEFVNNIACIAPEWLSLSLLIWELALRND